MRATRWSDNDHYFGPFTYAYTPKYKPLSVILSSVGDEEYDSHGQRRSTLRLSGFGHTLISSLPMVVPPWKEKVYPAGWDNATVERLGRNWYWKIEQREFGFSYADGFLQVFRGLHTMDSTTDRTWSTFLPWTQWRHVRHSYYTPMGEHFWTQGACPPGKGFEHYQEARDRADQCPTQTFAFKDYDGEELKATCRVEEMEWRFGTGRFKWLSIFRKPKIRRSLDIRFSSETGKRKGSWKGGTLGHSIEMSNDGVDFPRTAFLRYCEQNEMKFIGQVSDAVV